MQRHRFHKLHHNSASHPPFPPLHPQHSLHFRPFSIASSSELRRGKKKTKKTGRQKKVRLHPHTYRHNIKIEHENRHPKMTVQKSTHFTPSLTKPKKRESKEGGEKRQREHKGRGRKKREKVLVILTESG